MNVSAPDAARSTVNQKRELRRVLLSSYLGSAIEYYDFLLYVAAASLVFGDLFFSNMPPVVATLASLSTLAVGYLSRPLGAVIFGHYGDKIGRKSILVITLLIMGVSTALIGLLPTSNQVGALAPILLVLLRFIQGISVGGEWGGAALMAFEHAPEDRRGFASSFAQAGGPTGTMLAAAVLGLFALLPKDQFMTWGWRIPFLLSAVLVAIGLWVRLRISESPLFVEEQRKQVASGAKAAIPLMQVLRQPRALILVFIALLSPFLFNSLLNSFGLTFAKSNGLELSSVLAIQAAGGFACVVFQIVSGALSDRFGRTAVMTFGMVAGVLFTYPFLLLTSSGEFGKVLLAFVVMNAVAISPMYGPMAAYLSEQFRTGSRYTGASLGYQAASTVGGGFGPMLLATLIAAANGMGWGYILAFTVAIGVLSALAMWVLGRSRSAAAAATLESIGVGSS
ncbi:MHS family shikimate/dehydroshikimate transporter-like MFS transporter [Arthrobacter sp. GAS37]|uniref:MFS transporter n=1 Tax=Arthrobacter sp. GAS37 TaxID=3156261 RepID=UPI0038396369